MTPMLLGIAALDVDERLRYVELRAPTDAKPPAFMPDLNITILST